MSVFWSLATVMVLLALAFILPPLLRIRSIAPRVDQDDLNTEVARVRLAELALDLENGRLEQTQYEAARQDLERELLDDLNTTNGNDGRRVRSGRWAVLVIAAALPASATLLYKTLGSEQIIALLQQQPPSQQAQQDPAAHSVEEMIDRLAIRLQSEPDNLRGWLMLAKSYSALNRYDRAVPAYRNIMRLGGGNDAGVLADFADALAATAGTGKFTDEAGALLTSALQLDPNNIKALWLAGHWQKQSGDTGVAIGHWERAAGLMQPGSQDRLIISQQIQQARQQAGLPSAEAQPTGTTTPAAIASAAGGSSLQVTVALDPALSDKASAEDTVFIYARAAKGPRMPLAIVRKQVGELPVTVTLDDAMAMAPGMTLSGFQEVTVGARISKSGNAMAQSGDLQGSKTPVRPADTANLDIVIDSIVP